MLVTALMLTTSLWGVFAPYPAVAQSPAQEHSFAIARQPLSSALIQFANASGIDIFFDQRAIGKLGSGGLSGRYTTQAGLTKLLAGTGLNYSFTGANSVTISGDVGSSGNGNAAVDDGSLLLDTLHVRGGGANSASGSGFQGTPDWVYETPAGISVVGREEIVSNPARNTRDLLDNVAGVVVNRSEAQNPGIVINMRGVQDQDRIATMIDGARQSFQRGGHGATQRVYVESAFLREIDVEKTTGSGVGGIGALAGSVNFRTVEADDLIRDGRNWGLELNATTGTNAYNFDGSILGAWRPTDIFSVTAGLSYKNIGAYEIGQKGDVLQNTTYDGDIMLFSGQEVASGLLKFEIDPTDDLAIKLGWVRNNSDFSTGNYDNLLGGGALSETKEEIVVDTLTASLDWNPADNDLIDLSAKLYHNRLKNTSHAFDPPTVYSYTTTGGSVENTSRFDLGRGALSFNYGGEAFHDSGELKLGFHWMGSENYADQITGATPTGGRSMVSGFGNVGYEDDMFLVSGGLRYDWYETKGSTTFFNYTRDEIGWNPGSPGVCLFPAGATGSNCFIWNPAPVEPGPIYSDWYYKGHEIEIDRSGGALLPSAKVAVKPFEWVQLFAGYSQSYRPPTIMESFINGSSHQNSVTEFAPNPFLEPERARTFEIGANIKADGIVLPDDSFRMKLTGFHRKIEDYIAYGRFQHPLTAGDYTQPNYTTFVNLIDPTVMRGIELEANYDAGSFYIGGSASWLDSEFGLRYRTFNADGSERTGYLYDDTAPVVFLAPDFKVVLDAGVRLFDQKLTLGAKMTHVTETSPIYGQLAQNNQIPGYTVYDVYGSYKFNEDTTLRAAVTNVTDKAYVTALGTTYYAAPGRTFTASLNFKF